MNEIAHALDVGLIGLFAFTIALVLYKVLDLWLPRLVGRLSFEEIEAKHDRRTAYARKAQGLYLLGTIATAAPFIGLTGTVMHIIEALQSLSSASADITLISGPLATALYSTVWGLASALPATIAYNMMVPRVLTQMERGVPAQEAQ